MYFIDYCRSSLPTFFACANLAQALPGCAICTVHARSPYKRDTLVHWSARPW